MVSANETRPRWDFARQVSADILAAIPKDAPAAFALFRDSILEKHDLSKSPQALTERLLQIDSKDEVLLNPKFKHTELVKSVQEAVSVFGTPMPGDTIFLVAKGVDAGNYAAAAKLEKYLRAEGIRLFPIVLYDSYFQDDGYKTGVERLRTLAEATGGDALIIMNASNLLDPTHNQEMRDRFKAISLFYTLDLELKDAERGEVPLEIAIRGRSRKDTNLLYVRKLAACPQNPVEP